MAGYGLGQGRSFYTIMITALKLMESKQRHLAPGEEGEMLELVHLDMGCELAEAVQ